MTTQERIAEPAMAPSVYLSLRQAVRPASYAHFLLAEDQERAGQLAAECEDLFFLTRELLKALVDGLLAAIVYSLVGMLEVTLAYELISRDQPG